MEVAVGKYPFHPEETDERFWDQCSLQCAESPTCGGSGMRLKSIIDTKHNV